MSFVVKTSTSDSTPLNFVESAVPTPNADSKPNSWKRFIFAGFFISLGLLAFAAGAAVIGYRWLYFGVEDGFVNGRKVQLSAPIEGYVKAIYLRPGVEVQAQQTLAKIASHVEPVKLAGEAQMTSAQLEAAMQSLAAMQRQLHELELQEQALQQVDVALASSELSKRQAELEEAEAVVQNAESDYWRLQNLIERGVNSSAIASQEVAKQQANLEKAIARANTARLDYERHQQLLAEGVIPQRQVDRLYADWVATQANVKEEQAALQVAKMILEAAQVGVALSPKATASAGLAGSQQQLDQLQLILNAARAKVKQAQANVQMTQKSLAASEYGTAMSQQYAVAANLADQRLKLIQSIQNQTALVTTLKAAVESNQQQLQYSKRDADIFAPFTGVVYSTHKQQGEQVNPTEPIVTLLDCSDRWVEATISAKQATRINAQKPVLVKLAGASSAVAGQVKLIQPLNNLQNDNLPIQPKLSPQLAGQPLVVVQVKVPLSNQPSQQFCGVGHPTRLTFAQKFF